MDKAFACHAGGRGLMTKDFFDSEKSSYTYGYPCRVHSLPQWLGVTLGTGDLLRER